MQVINEIKFYNLPDLMNVLKVCRVTVLNYLKDGKIPGKKLKGKWIVSEDQFNEYLTSSENTTKINEK